MYKIFRGSEAFGKGIPYMIISAFEKENNNVFLERFILVVNPDKEIEPVFISLRTRISQWDVLSKIDPTNFELSKLLEAEIPLAKQALSIWLREQIKDLPYTQIQQLEWEKIDGAIPLTLECIFNAKVRDVIRYITNNSLCEELSKFLGSFAYLKLHLIRIERGTI